MGGLLFLYPHYDVCYLGMVILSSSPTDDPGTRQHLTAKCSCGASSPGRARGWQFGVGDSTGRGGGSPVMGRLHGRMDSPTSTTKWCFNQETWGFHGIYKATAVPLHLVLRV